MKIHVVDAECRRCGSPALEVLTCGRIYEGTSASAIFRCSECGTEHRFHFVLDLKHEAVNTAKPQSRRAECGTESGYKRHRLDGEDPCVECKAAHAGGERRRWKNRRQLAVTA